MTGSSDILAFRLVPGDVTKSAFVTTLLHNNRAVHNESVSLIQELRDGRVLTASGNGVVALWGADLGYCTEVRLDTTEEKASLHFVSSAVEVPSDGGATVYYLSFGPWVVGLEEQNGRLTDISPKRVGESIGFPYGQYTVDVSRLLVTPGNIIVAVTGENATVHVLQNVRERKRDVLRYLESKKLSAKVNYAVSLDPKEGSFLLALNNRTVAMIKDAAAEMQRRQEAFVREMHAT